MPQNRLFLIGLPGAGKTSIGKKLAEELNYEFIDTDKSVASHAGVDLGWIQDVEGDEGLMKRHEEVIFRHQQASEWVMAIGGGSAISANAQSLMRQLGLIIYLEVDLSVQSTRLSNEAHRPFLHDCDNKHELLATMARERHQNYVQLADKRFSTSNKSVSAVVQEIISGLSSRS